MGLISLRLLGQRPIPHILHTQGRGHDKHLGQGLTLTRLKHHATHARVQRPVRQFAPHRSEFVVFIHRAQLCQELVTIRNGFGTRGFHEGETLHLTQVQ